MPQPNTLAPRQGGVNRGCPHAWATIAGLWQLVNSISSRSTSPDPSVAPSPDLERKLYYDGIQPYLSKTTLAALDKSASQQEWNAFLLASPEFNSR